MHDNMDPMTVRTRTIAIDAEDTALDALPSIVDAAVADACLAIEAGGGRVIGPVNIVPISTSVSNPQPGDYRDHWSHERGLLAIITYEE